MKILGISAYYHDSAAAIIEDGIITAAAQEERFSRIKHDPSFPEHAVKFCLDYTGSKIDDLEAVVFYDKPLLKFERLLETYYGFAPKGLNSFMLSMPIWVKEKLFLKKIMVEELSKIQVFDKNKIKLLFPEHHLSHAASAFFPSGFNDAAIITIDGVGEWATASICYGKGNDITILKELKFPHSVGLLYSAFTYYLGFKVNSGEYKLMGLAPYGNRGSEEVKLYISKIKSSLVDIKSDGSIWLNQDYFNYAVGLTMANDQKWENLFGIKRRHSEDELLQQHCNLGLAIQQVTEEIVTNMTREAKKLTGSVNLCMAGGVALNCVANGKIQRDKIFENFFIQPAAGDAGGAPGAALAAYHIYFKKDKIFRGTGDLMSGAYLGPEFTDLEIRLMAKKYKANYRKFIDFEQLCTETAMAINDGNVIGWMQGRMEFGPRALGGRSIIGDARNSDMQKKLNLKIKYRESFRPFAPSVLAEDASSYFEMDGASPYMLLVHNIQESLRLPLPDDYNKLDLKEKLYCLRSKLPAITHIDFSARIQTIHKETNPAYHQLISAFKKLTGCSVIVNTSFNVRGEPIVMTPEDGYRCFMRTEMDMLVIGNYLFVKMDQPEWTERDNWKEEFVLD